MKKQMSFAFALALFASPAFAAGVQLSDDQLSDITAGTGFQIVKRVSDQHGVAPTTDPNLINAWGLANAPGSPLWVSDNGTGMSTLYDFNTFKKVPLNVTIPGGSPTGVVFDALDAPLNTDFNVTKNGKSGHSDFIFATEAGNIEGWSPMVDQTSAIIAVRQPESVFKGLALVDPAKTGTGVIDDVLFAADFLNDRVDEYNSQFKLVGHFTDSKLPAGYGPFNVAYLNGLIYVSFAKLKVGTHDEMDGPGLGFLDVFTTQGHFVKRLVSNGKLNAPWGMLIAPSSFGKFAGQLLVGNFGDGEIHVYNPSTGAFEGTLTNPNGTPMKVDGLWALHSGPNGTVTFSAGPGGEAHGLIGSIETASTATMASVDMHAKGTAMTGIAAMGMRH